MNKEQTITIKDPFDKGDIEMKFIPYDKQKALIGIKDNKHLIVRDETFDEYMEEEYKKWEDEYEPGDIKSMRFYGIKRK